MQLRSAMPTDAQRRGRLLIGTVGLLVAIGYTSESFLIPAGGLAQPGPGLFPRGVGIAFAVISIIVMLEAVLSENGAGPIEFPRGEQLRLVLVFAGCTLAFALLLPILGQYLAATLYLIVMIRVLSELPWWRVALYGAVLGVGVSAFFIEMLLIRLPEGLW
ncbi:tripartite tricarboxylate transporter TctB family protein [Pseudonocardia alaniniphila]|uniref:Tripartite tricarboxylate transporter TctB family protein n=1 Tax=Pseudonocardia alaniniphila TaxID=75291 RepID=A0ABS9TU13_9PSEU|nr:tripartite tricarboxylate transporter TctB family protein [Pseudonocardia alaniniphila]MCH6172052.1 tripartite tricarboxylate transporter TctB family protein [Pseudonocardia alaniniphila]